MRHSGSFQLIKISAFDLAKRGQLTRKALMHRHFFSSNASDVVLITEMAFEVSLQLFNVHVRLQAKDFLSDDGVLSFNLLKLLFSKVVV